MRTTLEAFTALSSPLHAANDEVVSAPKRAPDHPAGRAGGWDPYEVWRTRIKDQQDRTTGREPPAR